MQTLIKKLNSRNIKPSHQRIKILEILEGNCDHPNVSMIFDLLCKEMPTISKTTVYNTLNTFAEKGLVNSLTITPEELRYDCITIPHHHLLCKRCGRIIDVEAQYNFAVKHEIDGHKIEEFQGYFKGVCRFCLVRDKADKTQQ
jgi:Fur family peroxide stress response transcriptional regulator